MAAAIGSQPALTTRFGGATPWSTSPSASSRPRTAPGQMPAAEPIRPTIAASHEIMRRIWPGVAATARRSAISRSRCWIDRPIVLATTKIAMNSASPPNAAVTAISSVRVCRSSGYSARPRASPVSTFAPPAAARRRAASKPRRGEHPDRVDPPGMTGQARRFAVGEEDRRLAPHGVARPGDADHGDGARGFGGRQAQLLAERGGIAGDDLVGAGGRASRAQHVRRERGAAPPVGDGVTAAEAGRRRDVGDRRADAGDGRQPAGE